MEPSAPRALVHKLAYPVIGVILPLVLGTILAFVLVRPPQVGVITFQDVIWSGSIEALGPLLDRVQEDWRIRAVVLAIDSPGGEVTSTEELYYRLLELRERKPLVVTVGNLAASGGYYAAAAADRIYAKPASLIGNVGVISFLPPAEERRFADEDYVATGPFKFSGGSRGDYVRQIELAKLGFLEAVYAQRAPKLLVDRQTLASGEIFMGLQAVRLGLVDVLGASTEAVAEAARLAHLAHYETLDVNALVHGQETQGALQSAAPLEALLGESEAPWRQRLYYLYIEPQRRMR